MSRASSAPGTKSEREAAVDQRAKEECSPALHPSEAEAMTTAERSAFHDDLRAHERFDARLAEQERERGDPVWELALKRAYKDAKRRSEASKGDERLAQAYREAKRTYRAASGLAAHGSQTDGDAAAPERAAHEPPSPPQAAALAPSTSDSGIPMMYGGRGDQTYSRRGDAMGTPHKGG